MIKSANDIWFAVCRALIVGFTNDAHFAVYRALIDGITNDIYLDVDFYRLVY
jgi:hypothetical protein